MMIRYRIKTLIILCLIFLFSIVSCTKNSIEGTSSKPESSLLSGMEDPDITGAIKKLSYRENKLVKIFVVGEIEENILYDKAFVEIIEETKIFSQIGDQVVLCTPEDLVEGQIVEVLFKPGTIKEKYPAGAKAAEIMIISKEATK